MHPFLTNIKPYNNNWGQNMGGIVEPGCMPSFTKVNPIFALLAAILKSHPRVIHIPAPIACPLIAAIVGTLNFLI